MTTIAVPPAAEPVSIDEVQDHLGIDDDQDESIIRALIVAARENLESRTGRGFINRTVVSSFDRLPISQPEIPEGWTEGPFIETMPTSITLPTAPVVDVESISYFDTENVRHSFDADRYMVDVKRMQAVVFLNAGASWPTGTRRHNAIEIRYNVGYGVNPTDVPEAIRLAIKMLVAHLYENRGDSASAKPPSAITRLIAPYRILSL